jgi:hypothetical protein
MSEDRFFQNIRATMVEYSPEVPHSVYTGMRKKLWWSDFTKISATRFNIWYAALIVISGSLLIGFNSKDASSVLENSPAAQSEISTVVSQEGQTSAAQEDQTNAQTNAQTIEKMNEEASAKPVIKTATSIGDREEKPADAANTVAEKVVPSEQNTAIELVKDGKSDSSASVGKAVKKGLKVKTFQVTDK